MDPLAFAVDLERATARMLDTVATLTDERLAEASLLPGWTRGHVVSHITGNAVALNNLLTWGRTGVETPGYASPEARAAGIEAGAGRSAGEHLAALRTACDTFAASVEEMPAEAWPVVLNEKDGSTARVVWRRLREVEVHHVDLAAGYTWRDWPESFTQRVLHETVSHRPLDDGSMTTTVRLRVAGADRPLQLGAGDPAVTVSGSAADLAGWLSGRSAGTGLTVEPAGDLPTLSTWM